MWRIRLMVWRIRSICASKAFFWMCFLYQTLAILFLLYYFYSITQKMRYLFENLEVFRFSAFNLQPFLNLFPKIFCSHSEKATLRLYFSECNNFPRCLLPLNGVFYLSMDFIEIFLVKCYQSIGIII